MARTPLRDGWRVLMRAPAAVLTEIVWRWTFGLAFWAILYYSFREYFATVEISNAEYSLMRSLEPFTWIAITARVMIAIITGLRLVGPIVIPALIVLWTVLATIGRAATVRALSDSESRTNWTACIGLHFFRAVLIIVSLLAFFGCGILTNNLVGDPSLHYAAAFLLSFFALMVISLVWSLANWFFSVAAIFTIRDNAGFFGSLAQTAELYRRHSNLFFSAGFWFGLMRSALAVAVTILSLLPAFRLGATHVRFTMLIVVILTLGYFAFADFLHLWRLAAYISFTEPESEPPVVMSESPPTLDINSARPSEPTLAPDTLSPAEPTPDSPDVADRFTH